MAILYYVLLASVPWPISPCMAYGMLYELTAETLILYLYIAYRLIKP